MSEVHGQPINIPINSVSRTFSVNKNFYVVRNFECKINEVIYNILLGQALLRRVEQLVP